MIRQCSILFGCLALGELIVYLTGIKLPSSIIGIFASYTFLTVGLDKARMGSGIDRLLGSQSGFLFLFLRG